MGRSAASGQAAPLRAFTHRKSARILTQTWQQCLTSTPKEISVLFVGIENISAGSALLFGSVACFKKGISFYALKVGSWFTLSPRLQNC